MGKKTNQRESIYAMEGVEMVHREKLFGNQHQFIPSYQPELACPGAARPPCPHVSATPSAHVNGTQKPNPRQPHVPLSSGTSGFSLSHARPVWLLVYPPAPGSSGYTTLCLFVHLAPPSLWSGAGRMAGSGCPVSHPDSHN